MGVTAVIGSAVCVIVMGVLSLSFWDDLDMLRNLVLIWGTPLVIGLAIWRSVVAEKQVRVAQEQVEIAQRGLLSNRYQRAVEMLGHDLVSIRIGGIQSLRAIALEHNEYQREVVNLLETYFMNSRGSTQGDREELRKAIVQLTDRNDPIRKFVE